jgi:hypothetical protein
MCQPLSRGGRRCPIHQNTNRAAIKTAAFASGLTIHQVERLFAELRREGRHAPDFTPEQQKISFQRIREYSEMSPESTDINRLLKNSQEDTNTDGASAYAQKLIITKSVARSDALQRHFRKVAERTGFSLTEVEQKFDEIYNNVEIRRGEEHPSEYNQNTRRHAAQANLPYDVQSVVALERLNNLEKRQIERRVELHDITWSSHISAYGYDEGRLEIAFLNNPEQVFAYHNVPEGVWDDLRGSDNPGSYYYRYIRGNSEYTYDSAEEAEQDAFRTRCESCGQFRAADHSCPESMIRDEIAATGLPVEEISEALVSITHNENNEEENVTNEETFVSVIPNVVDNDVREPVEENTTPAVTAEYVVPLENIPVFNAWVSEPLEPIDDENVLDKYGDLAFKSDNAPTVLEYSANPTNQRFPEEYDASTQTLVGKIDTISRRSPAYMTGGSTDEYNTENMSDEQKKMIADAPRYLTFIIERSGGVYDHRSGMVTPVSTEILKVYDNREHMHLSEYQYSNPGGHGYNTGIYVYPKLTPLVEGTHQDHLDAIVKERTLLEEGKAVLIPQTTTATRKYIFDKNLSQQPKIVTGNAVQFKKAIKEGKAAIIPVQVSDAGLSKHLGIDDQGYRVSMNNSIVSGNVVVRKNADGVMEVVSNERSLKCSCQDYRNKYYCRHINYVHRHMGNVAQQMVPETGAATVERDNSAVGRLMTRALASRTDVTIVEPEKGEAYVSFGKEFQTTSGRAVKTEATADFVGRLTVPNELLPVDENNITHEELTALMKYTEVLKKLSHLTVPRAPSVIRNAIKKSDVEFPVGAMFTGYTPRNVTSGRVTGSIIIGQQADGNMENATIKSHTLKCSCEDYRTNYDCIHVRTAKTQAFVFAGMGSDEHAQTQISARRIMSRYSREMEDEEEILAYMAVRPQDGRAAAVAAVAERREEDRLAAIELEERMRVRREAENARRIEESRVRAELLRTSNRETVAESAQYRENMMKRWETVDESYSQNPETFFNDYKEALARKNKGESPIPFRTENVTDGICADEPGARRFGVELEFDIKAGTNRREALKRIGEELKEAGLTDNAEQQHYHSAAGSGWAKWSFENDCTVDAELVSPIMKDTPEDWKQLQTAIEIITRNGGVATTKAGSHVHVSTASYEGSTAKHIEVLRQVNQNEDVLYRLASNPKRGTHRGTQWCAPNVNDQEQDVSPDLIGGNLPYAHGVALNFEAANNDIFKKSNIEFRMWDATLDASVIQQQIVLSAAITDAAEREVIKNAGSKKPTKDRIKIGAGKFKEIEVLEKHKTIDPTTGRVAKPKHTVESLAEANTNVTDLFDKIFRRKEDRAAATALFAITNWQTKQ